MGGVLKINGRSFIRVYEDKTAVINFGHPARFLYYY